MKTDEKAIAVAFVTDIGKGCLDPDDLSDDFTAWSVTSGVSAKNVYLQKLKIMHEIFKEPLAVTIDTVTAEPGRVAIQARSRGELFNDAIYSNDYMFLIEFNDAGKIRHVREYYDQRRTTAILGPAREAWQARK